MTKPTKTIAGRKLREITFDPYSVCPDWDKLSFRDQELVFNWYADKRNWEDGQLQDKKDPL